jgi:hypothetical protein
MGPMLRWFVFTIGMGLLPFGFSVLLQTLRGVPPSGWQNSPELLFFSVMISAVQMGEIFCALSNGTEMKPLKRTALSVFFCVFLLGAILGSLLYGVYADHERYDPALAVGARCSAPVLAPGYLHRPDPGASLARACEEWLDFQTNLYTFSIGLAAVLGVTGTAAEWTRTRRRT